MNYHTPVLTKEVLEYLNVREGEKYIDATVGGGGHATEIIKRGGNVLGIDQDSEALEAARTQPASPTQLTLVQGNFHSIGQIAHEYGFTDVAGVLFDLGTSSYQLEQSGRGFSFRRNELLDMRMDTQTLRVSAADLLNGLTEGELKELFRTYGEEPKARQIAREIVVRRDQQKIETTSSLTGIIESIGGTGKTKARVFQALRIAVNDELNALREALPKAIELLKPGGCIAVISFHSLEDRIVKQEYQKQKAEDRIIILTPKPVTATRAEIQHNPKASSAKLRAGEKK